MTAYSIKDKVVLVGIGETKYYKRGGAPESEVQLALTAIQQAVADAGLRIEDTQKIILGRPSLSDPF